MADTKCEALLCSRTGTADKLSRGADSPRHSQNKVQTISLRHRCSKQMLNKYKNE